MFKKKKNIKTGSKPFRTNKSGIVIFDNNEDLVKLFAKHQPDSQLSYNFNTIHDIDKDIQQIDSNSLETVRKENCHFDRNKNQQDIIKNRVPKKDRHGLPFLEGRESLFKMFTDAEAKEEENFPELLATVLKGKGRDVMLREKSDKPPPEPVPLKKRLKRYPPPQEEMDLHGYTANEAKSKTETYLRNCWRNGLFTVQIIVGRGIHSPYGAVLPDVVEDLLIRLKQEGVLLWFEWEKRTKSQSGAVIAYLKQF